MRVAGFSPIAGAVAGLVIWAAHFSVLYLGNAIICARGLAERMLFGLPVVLVLIIGATALALGGTAVLGMRAGWRLQHDLSGERGEDKSQFTAWLTVAIALLSALAILWAAVPALILRPCG